MSKKIFSLHFILVILKVWLYIHMHMGFQGGTSVKASACRFRRHRSHEFDPWIRKILWGRKWQLTPVFLPGKFHGQRSLVGCSPWGRQEWDMTEHAHTHINIASSEFLDTSFFKSFSSPYSFGNNKECYCEHICTQLLVPKQCSLWCISISGIAGWYIPCIDFYLYQLLPYWPPKLLRCALPVMC